jgi:hypothetical protein
MISENQKLSGDVNGWTAHISLIRRNSPFRGHAAGEVKVHTRMKV